MVWEPLLTEADPEIYIKNTFWILGLPLEISDAEVSNPPAPNRSAEIVPVDISYRKAHNRIERHLAQIRWAPGSESEKIKEAEDRLQMARTRLNSPHLRFIDEVFGIWPVSWGSDGQAVAEEPADFQKGVQLWQELSSSNYAAQHNLAVYTHAQALERELQSVGSQTDADSEREKEKLWETALNYWDKTLQNPKFWDRLQERARDLRLSVRVDEDFRKTLKMAIALTGAYLEIQRAEQRIRLSFSDVVAGDVFWIGVRTNDIPKSFTPHPWRKYCDRQTVQDTLRYALQNTLSTLKAFCQGAKQHTDTDALQGGRLAGELLENMAPKYALLRRFLGPDDLMVRQFAHFLGEALCHCLRGYENKTEDWETCVRVLEAFKEHLKPNPPPQKVEELLQHWQNALAEGDRWYAPGYWELPREVVNELEKAKAEMEQKNWTSAIKILRRFVTSKDPAVERAARFALAHCLRRQCVSEVNNLVTQLSNLSDRIDQIRNQLDKLGPLMAVLFFREFRDGFDQLVDEHNRLVRQLKNDIPQYFRTLLEARRLNPLNKQIEENLEQLAKLADNANVSLPLSRESVYVVWEVQEGCPSSEGPCWFCGQAEGTASSNLALTMWGNVRETSSRWGTRYESLQSSMTIPRCPSCHAIHDQLKVHKGCGILGWAILVGIVLAFAGFYYSSSTEIAIFLGLLGWVVAAVIANRLRKVYKQELLIQLAIKPLSAIDEYPPLREKLKKGWKTGECDWVRSNKALTIPKTSTHQVGGRAYRR